MKIEDVLRRVESLPPLPRTIVLIEEYRRDNEKEIDKLHNIISKDALIVTNLLRIANSAMFGFRSKIETPLRAISLLGINFTISIAISTSSQKILVNSLSPYGLTNDTFMNSSNMASVLASLWLEKIDEKLKDEIILPALLLDIGKFILSDLIVSEHLDKEFKIKIDEGIAIEDLEKEYLVELINIGICKFILKPIDYETFLDDIFNISKTIYEKSQVSNVKNSNRIYLNDELYWDKYTKQLFSNNSVVKLTKKEFILIELLILNGNTIYSNDRIINYLWEDYSDFDIQIINLKNIISRLRKKIPSLNIQNNYGFGYSLEILH